MALIINLILSVIIIYLFWTDKLRNKRMLLGAIFVIAMWITLFIDLKNDFKVNYLFIDTQCKLIGKNLESKDYGRVQLHYPTFQVEYSVEGQKTSQWAKYDISDMGSLSSQSATNISNEYDLGETYPCWYDPTNPDTIVLQSDWNTIVDSWVITIFAVLILIGMLIKL